MVRCDCAEDARGWVHKWSWRWFDGLPECRECTPRRVERDWQLLTRYVSVGKDGARTVVAPAGGGDKHTRKAVPLNCVKSADFCPQTGVCLLPPGPGWF